MPPVRPYKRPKLRADQGPSHNPHDMTGPEWSSESESAAQVPAVPNNKSASQQSGPASNPVPQQDSLRPKSALDITHLGASRHDQKSKLSNATRPAQTDDESEMDQEAESEKQSETEQESETDQESETGTRSDDLDHVMKILDGDHREIHILGLKNKVIAAEQRLENTRRLFDTYETQYAGLAHEVQRTRSHADYVVAEAVNLDVRSQKEIETKTDAFLFSTEYQLLKNERVETGCRALARVEEFMKKEAAFLDHARVLYHALVQSMPYLQLLVRFWEMIWEVYSDMNEAGTSKQPTQVKARWRESLRSPLCRDLMQVEMALQNLEGKAADAQDGMAQTALARHEEQALTSVQQTIAEKGELLFVRLCLLPCDH